MSDRIRVKVVGAGGTSSFTGTVERAAATANDLLGRGYAVTLSNTATPHMGLEARPQEGVVVVSEFGAAAGHQRSWEKHMKRLINNQQQEKEHT